MFDFDFLIYKGYKGIFKLIYDVEISVLLLLIVEFLVKKILEVKFDVNLKLMIFLNLN